MSDKYVEKMLQSTGEDLRVVHWLDALKEISGHVGNGLVEHFKAANRGDFVNVNPHFLAQKQDPAQEAAYADI